MQEGEIEPLGSNKLVSFDVRVVAATSRDLQQMVRDGSFREDLYYRLNVLPIRVPPLRERQDDIALLIEALCEDIAARGGGAQLELTADAQALLAAQPWRGNIRELRNVLEQLALRSDTHHIAGAQVGAVLQEAGLPALAPAAVCTRAQPRAAPVDALASVARADRRAGTPRHRPGAGAHRRQPHGGRQAAGHLARQPVRPPRSDGCGV